MLYLTGNMKGKRKESCKEISSSLRLLNWMMLISPTVVTLQRVMDVLCYNAYKKKTWFLRVD